MEFRDFWQEYPRRIGKEQATKEWGKLKPEIHDKVMKSLRDHKRFTWAGKEKKYIPHASTWLHKKRYEDEIEVDESVIDLEDFYHTEEEIKGALYGQ